MSGKGWLKNGNPAGDFRKAPRCGAKNRLAIHYSSEQVQAIDGSTRGLPMAQGFSGSLVWDTKAVRSWHEGREWGPNSHKSRDSFRDGLLPPSAYSPQRSSMLMPSCCTPCAEKQHTIRGGLVSAQHTMIGLIGFTPSN